MILYYSIFKPSRFFFPISLSLSNVRYAYGEKEVLQQVSHTFKMGKKYVIVGPSGNEKSTLLNILNGKLIDYEGVITSGEREMKELSGKSIREHILYIDQIPYLFNGTIYDSTMMGESFSEDTRTISRISCISFLVFLTQ